MPFAGPFKLRGKTSLGSLLEYLVFGLSSVKNLKIIV